MARYHYLYHIETADRPFRTIEDVAQFTGIAVTLLRSRFRTGAETVTIDGVEVRRSRVFAKDGGKAAGWRARKAKEYGSFAEYRRRRAEEDCD
jgi:hypothetical protein